jgi:starch synthase
VRDGIDGVLVPAHAPAALAAAILDLLRDPGKAEQLVRAGRERVLACFTPEAQASNMLDVYRQVAAAHKQR